MQTWLRLFLSLSIMVLIAIGISQMIALTELQAGLGLIIWISITAYICNLIIAKSLKETPQPFKSSLEETEAADSTGKSTTATIEDLKINLHDLETKLKETTEILEQTQAIKQRMESELKIGRSVQMNVLTLTLPNLLKRKDIELDAILLPAREVGGDFYDFYIFREQESYLFEQNTCCFCIGDVSGKGVPAALFMAAIKTLMKAEASTNLSPSKILSNVNQELSENNPDCMFATIFFGTLNLSTGSLLYTNAGHNFPYIRRQDGTLEKLGQKHGPAIGVIDGLTYKESRTTLGHGDILFSFTDGVTEALDPEENLFSTERLSTLLATEKFYSAKESVQLVHQAVTDFQGSAEQADDITMLALQFLGYPDAANKASELVIKDELLSLLRDDWE